MRGRGIDYEFRFNTSRWAENLLMEALASTYGFTTVRFGLSAVKPDAEVTYGTVSYKEPDLLVFESASMTNGELDMLATENLETADRSLFIGGERLSFVFKKAIAAVEVEFSPYRAKEMKGRDWVPRSKERWKKRPLKHANPPTSPNVIVKEEDLPRLVEWQEFAGVPVVVIHLFDQEAFAIKLNTLVDFDQKFKLKPSRRVELQVTSGIFKTLQTFDRTDAAGAAEKKWIFRVPPCSAEKVGDVLDVEVSGQLGISASRKYVAHPIFRNGKIILESSFPKFIRSLR
jgi:hypothetical protein